MALPAVGPAGNSFPPRGLSTAQQAPLQPQPHSLTLGPAEGRKVWPHDGFRVVFPDRFTVTLHSPWLPHRGLGSSLACVA